MPVGKVWHYPYFVRLFHTSTPLRSVELSKELQGVSACGESATISLLCHTIPHFHTSEKCGTKDEKESRDLVASTGHLCHFNYSQSSQSRYFIKQAIRQWSVVKNVWRQVPASDQEALSYRILKKRELSVERKDRTTKTVRWSAWIVRRKLDTWKHLNE